MKVIDGAFTPKPNALLEFQQKVEDLIEQLDGRLTVGEVIGALEFVKFNLLQR
jgi:hypothetical protein